MKKIHFVLFFNLLFSINSFAQYFNTNLGRLDPYSEFSSSKALPYKDSLWLINMSITRFETNNYGFFNSIVIIDNNGFIKKELFPLDTLLNHRIRDWVQTDDNKLIVVGTEYDSSNIGYFFILKLDEDLKFEFKKMIKIPRDIGDIWRLKLLPNGNLAFCGLVQNYDKINKKYQEQQGIFFLLNSNGDEVWHYEYGDTINDEKFYHFDLDSLNNIYLKGQLISTGIKADFQDIVVKINDKGIFKWSKEYGSINELNGSAPINILDNNKIVFISGYKDNDNFSDFGKFNYTIIDSIGTVKVKKQFGKYGADFYDCNCSLEKCICVGLTDEPDGKKQSGFIANFNSEGDTVWTRSYPLYIKGKKNTQIIYSINSINQFDYIVTGSTEIASYEGFGNSQQTWVMTVDSLGYDHVTQFPTSTYEPEEEQEKNIVTFYPNPTSGELFYRWKDLVPIVKDRWVVSFYDLQGRLVYTHPMSINENSLMLESLSPGVYPYVIRDSRNAYVTKGKVVVRGR